MTGRSWRSDPSWLSATSSAPGEAVSPRTGFAIADTTPSGNASGKLSAPQFRGRMATCPLPQVPGPSPKHRSSRRRSKADYGGWSRAEAPEDRCGRIPRSHPPAHPHRRHSRNPDNAPGGDRQSHPDHPSAPVNDPHGPASRLRACCSLAWLSDPWRGGFEEVRDVFLGRWSFSTSSTNSPLLSLSRSSRFIPIENHVPFLRARGGWVITFG